MANSSCLAIGINRYQLFQPLAYAQADAQALQQFLAVQEGWSPENCWLLAETAPPVAGRSTYPEGKTIREWIELVCQQSEPLWFFFSGYGIAVDGKDYLMPIDGNPAAAAETAIAARSLFEQLKNRGNAPVLVLLDINRLEAIQSTTPVGQEIANLAKELGIPTILSCQLDQFARETSELGHGLFAAALLEALRQNPKITLAELHQYLSGRLPELSEHHLCPAQSPLAIVPPALAEQPVLHLATPLGAAAAQLEPNAAAANQEVNLQEPAAASADFAPQAATPAELVAQPAAALVPHPAKSSMNDKEESTWWQGWLFWGGGAALLLALSAGVLYNNRQIFSSEPAPETTSVAKAPAAAPTQKPAAVAPPPAQPANASRSPSAPKPAAQPLIAKTPAPAAKPAPAKSPAASAAANRATLDKARALMLSNQASQFSKAIEQAQKIKPGEPLYDQAQADINRWSLAIMDIAQGRAQQGKFAEAIAAAKLVPKDSPNAYAIAQKQVSQWQQQVKQQETNRAALKKAKSLTRVGQASSYNQAIAAAQKIPAGQPERAEAQKLINEWSQKIYKIAQIRAASGKLQEAAKTAALVPEGTAAYKDAKAAIARWKAGKK